MKEKIKFLKLIAIVFCCWLLLKLIYQPYIPDYYSDFIRDITPSSSIEVTYGDNKLYYKGKLGWQGLKCLSSFEEKGMLPHGTDQSFDVKISGTHNVHYININMLRGHARSYQLWGKSPNLDGSYYMKSARVDLVKRCLVTPTGIAIDVK
ncbi:hypothetical protein ACSL9G_001637 [Vibrio fluvialis]